MGEIAQKFLDLGDGWFLLSFRQPTLSYSEAGRQEARLVFPGRLPGSIQQS